MPDYSFLAAKATTGYRLKRQDIHAGNSRDISDPAKTKKS